MLKLILLTVVLTGCAGLESLTPNQAVGAGAVGGAVVTKTVQEVKEVFTPDYKMLVHPLEICDIVQPHSVTCYLIPCDADKDCQRTFDKDKWLSENGKVLTVRRSLVANVTAFCEKNPDACTDFWGQYSGQKVVITEQ